MNFILNSKSLDEIFWTRILGEPWTWPVNPRYCESDYRHPLSIPRGGAYIDWEIISAYNLDMRHLNESGLFHESRDYSVDTILDYKYTLHQP